MQKGSLLLEDVTNKKKLNGKNLPHEQIEIPWLFSIYHVEIVTVKNIAECFVFKFKKTVYVSVAVGDQAINQA